MAMKCWTCSEEKGKAFYHRQWWQVRSCCLEGHIIIFDGIPLKMLAAAEAKRLRIPVRPYPTHYKVNYNNAMKGYHRKVKAMTTQATLTESVKA